MRDFIYKYWIEFAFGSAITALGMAYKKLRKKLAKQAALELGIQALLRDRIIQIHNYYLDKGFCPIYARENISALYQSYHELGGNGTVTDLIERLMDLPTEPQKGNKNGRTA